MKSKASFFSGSVFRSDWKRFWWVGALYLVYLLVSTVMPFFMDIPQSGASASTPFVSSFLFHKSGPAFAATVFLPVGLCALLFSCLHHPGAAASLHGTPLRRGTQYLSHCAAGLSLLAAPVLLCGMVLFYSLASPQTAFVLSVRHIGWWITVQLVYTLLFFSLTAFVGMFTGNIIANLLFPYIFAGLPMFLWMVGYQLVTSHLYGYYAFSTSRWVVFLYKTPFKLLWNSSAIPMYVGLSVLLLAGGYVAYRFRPVENAGEIIVFPKLRPVFIFGVALCAGFLGYLYAHYFWQADSILILLIFGLPGLLIAHMLSRRALTLRGFLKPCLGFCVFVLALFCVFRFDLTGYERHIPKQEDIAGVSIAWPEGPDRGRIDVNGRWAVETQPYDPVMTSQADIQNVIALHRHKIENRETPDSNLNLPISYTLKNGRTLRRFYSVSTTADRAYLEPVWNAEQAIKSRFPLLDGTEKTILQVSVYDRRMPRQTDKTYPEAQERLLAALEKDLTASTQYTPLLYNRALTSIDIQYTKPLTFTDTGEPVDSRNLAMFGKHAMNIAILPSYKNTLAVLQELGFYDSLPGPEGISAITALIPQQEARAVTVTDPAKIAEVYRCAGEVYLSGADAEQWITLDIDAGAASYRIEVPYTGGLPAALQ